MNPFPTNSDAQAFTKKERQHVGSWCFNPDGDPGFANLSEEEKKLLHVAGLQWPKLFERYAEAVFAGKKNQARIARYNLAGSHAAQLFAAARAGARKNASLRMKQLENIAKKADPRAHHKEPIYIEPKLKSDGATRYVHSYGLMRTAQQLLACDMLYPLAGIASENYAIEGGHHRAITQIVQAANAKNLRFGVRADIKNCFPSFP